MSSEVIVKQQYVPALSLSHYCTTMFNDDIGSHCHVTVFRSFLNLCGSLTVQLCSNNDLSYHCCETACSNIETTVPIFTQDLPQSCHLFAFLLGKLGQTGMDRPIKCFSLILEHEEH
jgi:hypothetical protein